MWSKQNDSRFPRRSIELKRTNIRTYRRPSNEPVYINKQPNHPPKIIADIPKAISKRLTNKSCSKSIFDRNVDKYQAALENSGSDEKITYND